MQPLPREKNKNIKIQQLRLPILYKRQPDQVVLYSLKNITLTPFLKIKNLHFFYLVQIR